MEKIKTSYQVTVSDFRRATYFGLFQRHRRALRIMFVVLAVGILYALGGVIGLGQINPLVLFLAGAYLIWGLLLFAGAEKGVRQYIRHPDSLIGCEYQMELESNRIRVEVPQRKISFATQINKLTCVFETSGMFLIYSSLQDVHILPHRALTPQQRAALRSNFRKQLGDNFGSRFS